VWLLKLIFIKCALFNLRFFLFILDNFKHTEKHAWLLNDEFNEYDDRSSDCFEPLKLPSAIEDEDDSIEVDNIINFLTIKLPKKFK
jgi:hypothetical protein